RTSGRRRRSSTRSSTRCTRRTGSTTSTCRARPRGCGGRCRDGPSRRNDHGSTDDPWMPRHAGIGGSVIISGLVLAAGGSRRLGRPKQLLPYRGGTLLGHVVETARACAFDQLVVAV